MSTIILKSPVVTEKATALAQKNVYLFVVGTFATKDQIRQAVERFFKVKVQSVNTSMVPGKLYRTKIGEGKSSSWKKAIVTLKAGEKIEFFKGV